MQSARSLVFFSHWGVTAKLPTAKLPHTQLPRAKSSPSERALFRAGVCGVVRVHFSSQELSDPKFYGPYMYDPKVCELPGRYRHLDRYKAPWSQSFRRRSFPPGYRGTSLIRHQLPFGPYSRPMPRALWWSLGGGGRFLMSEVPLYVNL
ncbi:hypothetical protein T484DRAFT_1966882, partial [Baffinella frigidus]